MKGKQLRARKAQLKKLRERTEMQAFNQSLLSTACLRHGRKTMADKPVKEMFGQRSSNK